MRKKIGLLTITNGENYGNRLQNYAVQKTIENLGGEIYTFENITNQPRTISFKIKNKIKILVGNIYLKSGGMEIKKLNKSSRKAKFEQFNKKYINRCKTKISKDFIPQNISEEYDYFICGSDQVWNPYFSFNSEIDFLTFAKKRQRVAYSPSFGVSELPEYCKADYKKWIMEMNYLSVREEAGANIIKELTGRDAKVLLDPTLMLSKNEWLEIANRPNTKQNLDKKFILTYFLGKKDNKIEEKINKIAEKHNLQIINLLDENDKNIYCVDPSEFIWLINNCELMCTDSFHGAVFSLIMKTKFIVFERISEGGCMNSRLETLLSKFNMKNRLAKNISNDEQIFKIDFSKVDEIIENEREKTFNYLKNALNIQ